MQIACPQCKKAFAIDDAKMPAGPFAVKCPACQHRIAVTPPAAPVPPPAAPAPQVGDAPATPSDNGARTEGDGGGTGLAGPQWEKLRREVTLEVLKGLGLKAPADLEGDDDYADAPMALLCEDEAMFQEVVREALVKLGYRVEMAASTQAALAAVHKHPYEIITVDSRFPDDAEGGFKILQEINALPPEKRRKIFVAFVSADLNTMDTNSAFILGANLTVSKRDVKRLDRILAQGRVEHERHYRVFFQVKEEMERADA